jgi:hypothetical protein
VYPRPDLLFLTLRAHTREGLEFLAWLRAERQFLHLPVVVFCEDSSYILGAQEMAPHARLVLTPELWAAVDWFQRSPTPLHPTPPKTVKSPVPNDSLAA